MHDHWISERAKRIEFSGIRKVFDLARKLANPINLSIGQPHFDVPEPIKEAAHTAIDRGHNSYTVTQGIAELRQKIAEQVRSQYPHPDREVLVTSGTSGGLVLATQCTLDPGDEVILFDPYFVIYPNLVLMAGATPVFVDTYPDFQIDIDRVKAAITPRTKLIIANSPANPTGVVYSRESLRELAKLAKEREILLLSDEVYRAFCYDDDFISPAEFNEDVLVLDGFSKAYGMTGWRLGFAHGPRRLIEEMTKLQQGTFVCAPSIVQHAGVAALDFDVSDIVDGYRAKRDWVCTTLESHGLEVVKPGGAFYVFPKAPWGTGTDFVVQAIESELLLIPGKVFSTRDTHFRLSYAADDRTLQRGLDVLTRLARNRPTG